MDYHQEGSPPCAHQFFYTFMLLCCYYSYYLIYCSDDSEDGLDDNPLLPQPGGSLMQVKEEPTNSLLGESSGVGSSGMLNTHSLNGVLQSGKWISVCVG